MLNIVHIYSDTTFLNETERYNKFYFTNTTIIINRNISDNGVNNSQTLIVSTSEADLKKVITICSSADMVVLYELDYVKSYIALQIPQNIPIAWRFFGAELYDRKMTAYMSANSLKFYNTNKEKLLKILNSKIILGKLKSWIKNSKNPNHYFTDAMKRVDLFLCLCEYEYDHLTQNWEHLPPFVQIPLSFNFSKLNINGEKNLVLIGNSRSIYNNHIDIIQLIENSNHSGQLVFLIPFSYGMENFYTNEIKRLVSISQKHFELLENFMPYDSYLNLLGKTKAAVYNCYRQMAMGNIAELLNSGVKVYLSVNNVIYRWFKDLGLKIFTIEDFALDLESDKLELSAEDRERNVSILGQMSLLYSQEHFVYEVNNSINNKKQKI